MPDLTSRDGGQAQPEVILYTRRGCHLCDEAKEVIERLRKEAAFRFEQIDIDTDPALKDRYNDEVPVIFINGKKAFKYQVEPRQFLKRLSKRSD
jgi:glutaredoxin